MKSDKNFDILALVGLLVTAVGSVLTGWANHKKIDRCIDRRERKRNA